ncbi:unnamed protein product [Rotaria sordida]|uniref:Aminopeptidase n=2 Tax=Rotaria sordida TaxID=392033 RepID=A0A819ABK6_9BILA|nr:unnamed protein product [Rotaria sordida]
MNVTLFPLLVLFVFISYESKGEVVKSDSRKPRARDLGIPFDGTPGKYNAITDVEGVQVGFKTLIQGDSVRTGVTAVFPRGTDLTIRQPPCFANWFSLNGNGEMTGIHWLTESGFLTSPILITSTNYVGICRDSIIKWFLKKNDSTTMIDMEDVLLPVVAETWDGNIHDAYGFNLEEQHVFEALDNAKESGSFVQEGNVGGGTGMICFDFKAGTGTSSRIIEGLNYTVGVLVQANFGLKKQLIIAGVPVGKEIMKIETNSSVRNKDAGSIIVILATNAPLLPHQLKRLATRVSLGIGKLGGRASDSSGDIFLAFSTAKPLDATSTTTTINFLSNSQMNPLFEATIEPRVDLR